MGKTIVLNGFEYPVKKAKRETMVEYYSAIREGVARRTDRALADFRTEGEVGYPYGLGYKRGPVQIVAGGIWKGELRVEIPGQITLPLQAAASTHSAGDLSGEVPAHGRLTSCNTDVGNSSGKKRLYITAGTSIFTPTSDTNGTPVLNSYTVDAGVARIYHSGEINLNNTRSYAIGTEDPSTTANRGLKVSTNPTADPIVFADVETGSSSHQGPDNVYWFVSIDSLQRTYICWDLTANAAPGTWGDDGRVQMGYLAYSDALSATPTIIYTAATSPLHKGCQVAGVIGERIWLIDPLQDAQADPDVTKRLVYIDITRNHLLIEVNIRTRNVTLACAYDHPTHGRGIAYTDGKSAWHVNESLHHLSLGWLRHQGRDVACTVKGFNPTGDRLGVLVQADNNLTAWWEEYIPNGTISFGNPSGGIYGGSWYPFSKRFTTAVALLLPGGTKRGTTLPWNAERLIRFFFEPSGTNSILWRQKHYGLADRSNPLTTSLTVDSFEDGSLSCEFPLYDAWGGPEEIGRVLGAYFEGDANVTSTETVLWEYTTDQSTYPDFATYTAIDQTTTLASGGAAARRFGLRVTLDRDTTTTATPNGGIFVARGLKEPSTRKRFEYVIDVDKMSAEPRALIDSRFETAKDAMAVQLITGEFSGYVHVERYLIESELAEATEEERIVLAVVALVEVL